MTFFLPRLSAKGSGPRLNPGRLNPCRLAGLLCALAATGILFAGSGCQTSNLYTWYDDHVKQKLFPTPKAPPPPVDNFVMRGGGLEKDDIAAGSAQAELEGAKTLYTQGKYAEAEKIFHRLERNTKNPVLLQEEALFFEGDCQYLQGHLPKAESTFKKLLHDFRINGRFHDQATRRMFDIANLWLDDTRKAMKREEDERVHPANWIVSSTNSVVDTVTWVPRQFHYEKEKPLLDVEGRALEALEEVRLNDISGPLGERALFWIATVKFFRKDYKDADYYYGQVYEHYPNGKLAAKAMKHAIICKQMIPGGPNYDLRMLEQSRKLILEQARGYPELNDKDGGEFLNRQLVNIAMQQAAKDWNIAEFYKRTGHAGSAYFYYELVKRRYPGTSYSEKAIKRMDDLRARLEKGKDKEGFGSPVDFSVGPRAGIFAGPSPGGGMPGMGR